MKLSAICVVAAAIVLFAAAPQAQSSCTTPNSILHSTYGWEDHGLAAAGNSQGPTIGAYAPLVRFGYFTFNGNGNFSGAHDTNFGGGLLPHVDAGTYSVNSDCTTGTISFTTGAGIVLSIVITSGGQEIKFIGANEAIVDSGSLRLMAASCSASVLNGSSYSYSTDGLVAAGDGNSFPRVGGFVPFVHGGQISFGADGSISGVDNENLGATLMPGQPIAGTYTVNSDCTGTTNMTIGGVDSSWHFIVLQGADQIIFIGTPTGDIWAGTLTKQ